MSILLKLAEKKEEKKPGFFRRNKKKILIGAGTLAALTAAGYGLNKLHKSTVGKGLREGGWKRSVPKDEHDQHLDKEWWERREMKFREGRNEPKYDPDKIHRSGANMSYYKRHHIDQDSGENPRPSLSTKNKLIRMLPWNKKYKKFYEASDSFKNRPLADPDAPLPKRNTPSREFIESIIDGPKK